jgi:hypothetical protein
VPSVHPRCHQHGLVAPDGMCVLCRKQASSGPPPQQQAEAVVAPLRAAEAAPESTDKYAALLVGVALVTMAATYMLDTTKVKELTAAHAEAQREEDEEAARLQELMLAATRAEEQPEIAAAAQEQEPHLAADDEPE